MNIKVYCEQKQPHSRDQPDVLPHPLRCLIVGASGSGKTNLLLNFIYNENGVPFKFLYVFSRSLEQPAYAQLRRHYERIEKLLGGKKIAHFYSTCEDLIPLDECEENSLAVFDDCLMGEQIKLKDYFIRGRHKRISCVYLSQNYSRVDMQVIRNNVNLLCIFKQNKHYTRRIFEDFVGSDMSLGKFERFCENCWNRPYGFVSINVTKKAHDGKYLCDLSGNKATLPKRP